MIDILQIAKLLIYVTLSKAAEKAKELLSVVLPPKKKPQKSEAATSKTPRSPSAKEALSTYARDFILGKSTQQRAPEDFFDIRSLKALQMAASPKKPHMYPSQ